MGNDLLYLRQDVQVEPLCDQWYAWSHLISPATAARNITERHLKIMDSYVNAPAVHAKLAADPKLAGGPFIDYGGERVDEIRSLSDRTIVERAHMIELSRALNELNVLLQQNAKGYSLSALYESVPHTLRGYVELVYDLNDHPSFRLIEPLLYRSEYYNPSSQSFMLSRTLGDDRPFVMSTPRLEGPGLLHLRKSFADPTTDELFRLKTSPRTWSEIKDIAGVRDEDDELLRSFLTQDAPPPYEPYSGIGVRWRYFGHACILIESGGQSFLFDPVLSYAYESEISRYRYTDVADVIDYALITHNHTDHLMLETLLQLRHKVRNVVVPRSGGGALQDPSLRLALNHCGFPNVIEMSELDSIPINNGEIIGIPFLGEHADLDVRTKLAYVVRIGRRKLLFGADSCNLDPFIYDRVHQVIGNIDALFLGMECDGAPLSWLYGPLLGRRIERSRDESRRLSGSDYEQAIRIVERFACNDVYVYAMGQEPWLNHVMSLKYTEQSRPITESNRVVETCRARGKCAERLFGEKEILLDI